MQCFSSTEEVSVRAQNKVFCVPSACPPGDCHALDAGRLAAGFWVWKRGTLYYLEGKEFRTSTSYHIFCFLAHSNKSSRVPTKRWLISRSWTTIPDRVGTEMFQGCQRVFQTGTLEEPAPSPCNSTRPHIHPFTHQCKAPPPPLIDNRNNIFNHFKSQILKFCFRL